MITVTGFHYYNDNHQPKISWQFENIGQFLAQVKTDCLGKSAISFPAHNDDWSFNQDFAGAMCGCFRYRDEQRMSGDALVCVDMITDENEKILFSSGALTDRKGHISSITKEAFKNLYDWTQAAYEFAD